MPHKSVSKDRVWIFALGCFVFFVILEYIRLSFIPQFFEEFCIERKEYCHGFSELARDLALGLFPIGLTIVLMEYWLRSQTKLEIKEYIETEVTDVVKGKLDLLRDHEASGLVKIWNNLGPEELGRFISAAKSRIFILTPFFVEPELLLSIFEEKTKISNFIVKIVVLHPDSMFLRQRGQIIFGGTQAGKLEAEKTLRTLKRAFADGATKGAEVRVFDSLLSAFLVVADNRSLIGFYMNRGTALKNPHLEIRVKDDEGNYTPFGQMIEREFRIALSDDFSSKVNLQDVSAADPFTLQAPPTLTQKGPLAGLGGHLPVL